MYTLSPRWASQSPLLKQKVLKALGETVKKYPERTENAVTILTCYLDFTNKDLEQVSLNTAVLNMLTAMPDKYKMLEVVLKAVMFMNYEGERKESLHQAGLKFFRSIPKKAMYKKRNGSNNWKHNNLSKAEKIYCRDVGKYPLLTHIGEVKLGVLKTMGKSAEERHEARQELITSNLRLPFSVVKDFFWWTGMDTNRLVSEGNLGLMKAADKYNPCRGKKFSTYAIWWVRQSIGRYIMNSEDEIRVPVHVHNQINAFTKKCRSVEIDSKNKNISDEEIANAIGMESKAVQTLRGVQNYAYIYLDGPIGSENASKDAPQTERIGAKDNGFEEVENKVMSDNEKSQLEKIFSRVIRRINDKKINAARKFKMITILRERVQPKMEQTDKEKTLEEIGDEYDLTRERIRQLESKVKRYVKDAPVDKAEKVIVESLLHAGYKRSKDSSAEFLKKIYEMYKFDEFSRGKLSFLTKRYSVGVFNHMFIKFSRFSVFKKIKHGWYAINPIFKGRTIAETKENIAGIFDTTFEMGKKIREKKLVLNRYSCSKDQAFAIKECLKMDHAHRLLERMTVEHGMDRAPCIIRAWKGYAALAQEDLPQCIRDAMKNGSYEFKFLEIDKLVDLTRDKKPSENEITILPFSRLNESQKQTLKTTKAWFINMDFEKEILDPYAFVQLEAIIASAIAYLNNDDFTFNNLYKMLTDGTDDIKVSIEELKKKPILAMKYVFIISPGKVHVDDLRPLNERMKKLVGSSS
ncbi:MAG: sigma-70 family RNA polymerase sigma factor [Candidatus Omnitrophica bacterium]|nr:sigma-70 family RNA polymerase sigma factor [Candidatus Omnitrophota bacterium]